MPFVDENQIKSLLADGTVTAISVDTSIFDEKQLQLNSTALQALARFKNRPFDFLLSSTVAGEVQAHIKKASDDAYLAAKKGIGLALNAFDTRQPTRDEVLNLITGGKSSDESTRQRWEKFIGDTGCEVINDAELVTTATLFNAYFSGDPPFGSGRKKDEFPDALALNALERMANLRQTSMIVVSKDGDWRAFCEKSRRLYLVPEIERALDLVTNAPLGLRKTIYAWMTPGGEGHGEVIQHIEHSVERIDFTANGHPSQGEVEFSTWAGTLENIDWPDEGDFDFIGVEDPGDDGVIRVVLSVPLELIVRVMVEMSFSFWDNVDKESLSMGGRSIEIDEYLSLRATLSVDVHDFGGEDEEIVLVECELEDTRHEIELGEIDMFEPEDYWDGEELV